MKATATRLDAALKVSEHEYQLPSGRICVRPRPPSRYFPPGLMHQVNWNRRARHGHPTWSATSPRPRRRVPPVMLRRGPARPSTSRCSRPARARRTRSPSAGRRSATWSRRTTSTLPTGAGRTRIWARACPSRCLRAGAVHDVRHHELRIVLRNEEQDEQSSTEHSDDATGRWGAELPGAIRRGGARHRGDHRHGAQGVGVGVHGAEQGQRPARHLPEHRRGRPGRHLDQLGSVRERDGFGRHRVGGDDLPTGRGPGR